MASAERFKSVIVEDQPASLETVAAYLDLNPVRAGMVEDPKACRFCGYASALAGNALARQGLLSCKLGADWDARAAAYRMRLFVNGGSTHQSGKVLIDKEKIKQVIAPGGELSLAEVLRLRVRHLIDGVALRTKALVNEVFTLHREKFAPMRKDGARPIWALACIGMTALRDLRGRALGLALREEKQPKPATASPERNPDSERPQAGRRRGQKTFTFAGGA